MYRDSIWIGEAEDGLCFTVGDEIKAQISGILEGSDGVDNEAFQEMHKILRKAHVQIDRKLGSRQIAALALLVAESWEAITAVATGLASVFIAWDRLSEGENALDNIVYYPQEKASSFGTLSASASVTLSADGSAVATVVVPPAPTVAADT